MKTPLISVIVPAFDEEANIGSVLDSIHGVLVQAGFPYEIIVVNDGSSDKTSEVVKENNVVLVNHTKNLGKGAAIRTGLQRARGGVVVTIDADGSHPPRDIPRLVYPLINGNVDAVIGSRFTNEHGKVSTSELRLLGNRIINYAFLLLTRKRIADTQSGFRAYKREAFRKLSIRSSGFEAESEITLKMLKRGFSIKEVPIDCEPRDNGSSKVKSFKDGFKILKSILFFSVAD